MTWIQGAWETSNIGNMVQFLRSLVPKPGQEDLRGFEWYYFWQICHRDLMTLTHDGGVSSLAFSSDGNELISASEGSGLKLWNMATGLEIRRFKGHSDRVRSVAFSPKHQIIASGSDDGTVKIWDSKTGQELLTLKGHAIRVWSVAFSADGEKLASGSFDHTVKVWDTATGQNLFTLRVTRNWSGRWHFRPTGKDSFSKL